MIESISEFEITKFTSMLKDMMRLQYEYVMHLVEDNNCDFVQTLGVISEAYYYSDFFDENIGATENNSWCSIVDELNLAKASDVKFSFDSFWEIWSRHITQRIPAYLLSEKVKLRESYYGFTYEYHPMYLTDSIEDVLTLHFRNYFTPESPFDYFDKLKEGINEIVKVVCENKPEIRTVQCASWLNCVDKFRNLFGPGWKKFDCVVVPIEGNLGWWGQFIDRSGAFNFKAAERFRKNWIFEKTNQIWYCDIEELLSL